MTYKWHTNGSLMRVDQSTTIPDPGDRFFDVSCGRWAVLIRILPKEEANGAPYEALYDGCDKYKPFIATAMLSDIDNIIKTEM